MTGIFTTASKRAWGLIAAIGAIVFVVVSASVNVGAIRAASDQTLSLLVALAAALVVMGALTFILALRLRTQVKQVRTAIDSMAQGLCMFDAHERLVVCNTQYFQMYGLTARGDQARLDLGAGAGDARQERHVRARLHQYRRRIARRSRQGQDDDERSEIGRTGGRSRSSTTR